MWMLLYEEFSKHEDVTLNIKIAEQTFTEARAHFFLPNSIIMGATSLYGMMPT